MTRKDAVRLAGLRLCDLYTQTDGVRYRSIGDAADIVAVVRPDCGIRLQANVYPFRMLVQPFSRIGLERCKEFVRRWA